MKKSFYLTMTLLLTLAVGTSYADDDPSVVTLFEYSFENGMGNFTSVSSLNGEANSAWHYNEELHCVECSGDESGFLVSPIITAFSDERYFDITLTFEHSGSNAESYDIDFKIGHLNTYSNSMSWESYSTGDTHYWGTPFYSPSSSIEFSPTTPISLDYNCKGKESQLAIGFSPSQSANKYYRIKNLKITAHDWENTEGLREVYSISEMTDFENNTPIKLYMSQIRCVWNDETYCYINDGTGGVQTLRNNYSFYAGWRYNGYIYGFYSKNDGMPKITSVTANISSRITSDVAVQPKEINEDEYWDNLMEYVRMPITSDIHVWDFKNYLENSYINRDYTPNYETYFTGLLVPTENGQKRFLMTDKKSVSIYLPEIMETPLSNNERDFWGIVCRTFNAGEWYSLCLPFTPEYEIGSWMATIANFSSSDNGELNFSTGTSWDYFSPCLIRFIEDTSNLEGRITSIEPNNIIRGDWRFVGTLKTVTPQSGSYYLTAGNTIKPLATGGKINAFRGYFEPTTPAAARTRSIVIDGTTIATGDGTTDIEDILNDRTNDEGEVYNLNGQRVTGNSYIKGIYIINGKKVIK